MDNDAINKALIYAASIFITIIIITYVINYFAAARDMSNSLGIKDSIYDKYSKIIEITMKKDTIYGYEVKNLLNYFYDEEDIKINIDGNAEINNNENLYNEYILKINPIDKYKLEFNNEISFIKYDINKIN